MPAELTLGQRVVEIARREIGYRETGNNITKFWAVLNPRMQGGAWCAAFVTWCWLQVGVDLRKVVPWPYHCLNLERDARRLGVWRAYGGYSPKPGDIPIYGANVHTGLADPGPGSLWWAIEGNTSPGNGGSQANGGGVYRRGRPSSWVRGWIDMGAVVEIMRQRGLISGEINVVKPTPINTAKPAPRASAPKPAARWPELVVDGVWPHGAGQRSQTTLALQKLVGVPADGIFGPQTVRGMQRWLRVGVDGIPGPQTWRALQRTVGVTADGVIGPQTIRALQRYLNARN